MSDLRKPTLRVKYVHGKKLLHWRKTAQEKHRSVLYCRQLACKCALPNVRSEKINVERETDTSIVFLLLETVVLERNCCRKNTYQNCRQRKSTHAGEEETQRRQKTQRGAEEEAQSRGQTEMDLFPHLRPW
jgi:hypothetical protein